MGRAQSRNDESVCANVGFFNASANWRFPHILFSHYKQRASQFVTIDAFKRK
jgi:hypothetical protein